MKDYEITKGFISYYKNKTCKAAGDECDKCEVAGSELLCLFDVIHKFIEWENKHNR